MSYTLAWKNPALPGKSPITVPVTATVSTAASLTFTGKGAPNYGQIQQTNLLRLLENFADGVAPLYPTIGQTWFDSTNGVLNVCTSISPITWETLAGIQVTPGGVPPVNPSVGDMWFERFSHSGFLYVYTGTGRYPPVSWNAYSASYYPPVSPLTAPYLNIKINYDSFTVPNFSEAYIHGFTGSTPADVDGQIRVNGTFTNVPRGTLATNFPGKHGIVWDTTSTMVSTAGPGFRFFAVRQVGDYKFEYDNNSIWVPVTPVAGMHLIGLVDVAEPDDQTAPGISSAEVWMDAIPFSSPYLRLPTATGTGAAGGWHQIWPTVEHHGARFEYDAMMEKVLDLIGSPYTTGGNGAAPGLDLTDFQIVDSSISALAYNTNRDINVGPLNDSSLVAGEPTADDWDRLLAAARWAVNRLDLPANMANSVSIVPFTQDGRVASQLLQLMSTNDVRAARYERKFFRRYGSITGARLYAETMNALNAAITQRYSLKGIAGQNSTVTALQPDIATWQYVSYLANYTGVGATFNAIYLHATSDEALSTFITSGGAVDIKLDYTLPGSPTGNDTLFQSFINTNSTIRITADKVRVFGNSLPLQLTQTPINAGMLNATPAFVNIATITSGASSIVIAVARNPNSMGIRISLTGPGISGQTALKWRIINDTKTYGNDVRFFPRVNEYVTGDNLGTDVIWIQQGQVSPPIVNFTANTTTGPGPLAVNFTYTGTGSPSLVEWDFTGDGTFDATGNTASMTYSSSGTTVYMVRCRATNASGQDVLTRPTYITVT